MKGWVGAVEVLSPRGPRAYVLRGLLTDAECDYLIRKAEPDLKRSFTVDILTGKHKTNKARTSDDAVLARRADPTIAAIEEKIARVTMIPERNGEGLRGIDVPGDAGGRRGDGLPPGPSAPGPGQQRLLPVCTGEAGSAAPERGRPALLFSPPRRYAGPDIYARELPRAQGPQVQCHAVDARAPARGRTSSQGPPQGPRRAVPRARGTPALG